jgi:hypothetical protein
MLHSLIILLLIGVMSESAGVMMIKMNKSVRAGNSFPPLVKNREDLLLRKLYIHITYVKYSFSYMYCIMQDTFLFGRVLCIFAIRPDMCT